MLGLRARLDQVARFMEGVLGANKYRQYLEHLAKTHPDAEPMSEREFSDRLHRLAGAQPARALLLAVRSL